MTIKNKKSFDYYWSKKDYFAEVIASKGDIILYKSETKGAMAQAKVLKAPAVALLSSPELGISFLVVHC